MNNHSTIDIVYIVGTRKLMLSAFQSGQYSWMAWDTISNWDFREKTDSSTMVYWLHSVSVRLSLVGCFGGEQRKKKLGKDCSRTSESGALCLNQAPEMIYSLWWHAIICNWHRCPETDCRWSVGIQFVRRACIQFCMVPLRRTIPSDGDKSRSDSLHYSTIWLSNRPCQIRKMKLAETANSMRDDLNGFPHPSDTHLRITQRKMLEKRVGFRKWWIWRHFTPAFPIRIFASVNKECDDSCHTVYFGSPSSLGIYEDCIHDPYGWADQGEPTWSAETALSPEHMLTAFLSSTDLCFCGNINFRSERGETSIEVV